LTRRTPPRSRGEADQPGQCLASIRAKNPAACSLRCRTARARASAQERRSKGLVPFDDLPWAWSVAMNGGTIHGTGDATIVEPSDCDLSGVDAGRSVGGLPEPCRIRRVDRVQSKRSRLRPRRGWHCGGASFISMQSSSRLLHHGHGNRRRNEVAGCAEPSVRRHCRCLRSRARLRRLSVRQSRSAIEHNTASRRVFRCQRLRP
jgi:hypothetical protein